MNSRALSTLAAAGALAVAGCSEGAQPPPAPAASPTGSATTTKSASPIPSATSHPPAKTSRLKVGQTYRNDYISVTVQKTAVGANASGERYSGALVKTCVIDTREYDVLSFSWLPWTMVDQDAGRFPNSGVSGGSLPDPVFPNGESDGSFGTGDCVKGWIFFDVPKGTKVIAVRYQSEDMKRPAEWAVG